MPAEEPKRCPAHLFPPLVRVAAASLSAGDDAHILPSHSNTDPSCLPYKIQRTQLQVLA